MCLRKVHTCYCFILKTSYGSIPRPLKCITKKTILSSPLVSWQCFHIFCTTLKSDVQNDDGPPSVLSTHTEKINKKEEWIVHLYKLFPRL